jgi:hypothetical protein
MDHPQNDPPGGCLGVVVLIAIVAVIAELLGRLLGR